jgi:hypothetical protein
VKQIPDGANALFQEAAYTNSAEVGTCYIFRNPLPLVHYLEIVLLLPSCPQLQKIW